MRQETPVLVLALIPNAKIMMISISNLTEDDAGVDEQEVRSAVTCLSSDPRQYRLMIYSVVIFSP
jgi:hypothetical protein